ncbi:MAG TPA: DUF2970 domain-containing protein [Spongiibacteraceae bacterium]|nr:DUF2970 domain-containing protein [Spongiibacteraceae bacterium]
MNAPRNSNQPRRYFAQPDAGEKPLTLRETLVIVLAAHLGVRTARQREEDFRRASGLNLFIVGVIYFASLLATLIALVFFIAK